MHEDDREELIGLLSRADKHDEVKWLQGKAGNETIQRPIRIKNIPTKKKFSTYHCFNLDGSDENDVHFRCFAEYIYALPENIALYQWGGFATKLFQVMPELTEKVNCLIDNQGIASTQNYFSVIKPENLSEEVDLVILCTNRSDHSLRMLEQLPVGIKTLSAVNYPEIAKQKNINIPQNAWIDVPANIYPIALPEMLVESDLDLLLLDLPARNKSYLPSGVSYVHNVLKKSSIHHQTLDADIIMYHRYHIHRLLDLGHPPDLKDGSRMPNDPWLGVHDQLWSNARNWEIMFDYFKDDIEELITKIIKARPKILAFSVHALNTWLSRKIAQEVKEKLPDTIILIGGYSCYYSEIAQRVFPEYDYIVIGEAEEVIVPLVQQLISGLKPSNLPGIVSRFDFANRSKVESIRVPDLNQLDFPKYDWFKNLNIYTAYNGEKVAPICSSRGCQWSRCTFCAERFPWRVRSPENFVDELEWLLNNGFRRFMLNESDLNGNPNNLANICQKVIRRGLKLTMRGQLRVRKECGAEFYQLLAKAGFNELRFGIDAWSKNTLKLQKKGYTIKMVESNLKTSFESGIHTTVNAVIGVPGETEKDIEETVENLIRLKPYYSLLENIFPLTLAQGSVYLENPEKFGINFHGDKNSLYEKYYQAIPGELWYTKDPYIDHKIRIARFEYVVECLYNANIMLGNYALKVVKEVQQIN